MEDVNCAVHSTGHKRCVIANENKWNCKCVSTKNRTCLWFHGWLGNVMFHCSDPPPVSMSFQLKRGNVARISSVSMMVLTRVSASNEAAMNTEQLMLSKDCQWCGDWAMQPREVQTAHNLWHISKGWWIHFRTPRRLHNPPCIWTCIIWINPPPNSLTAVTFQDACFRGGVIYQATPSDSPLVHRPGYILRGGPMKFQLKWGMWVH